MSPRVRLAGAALCALAACAAAAAAAPSSTSGPPAPQVSAFGTSAGGTTGQGMVMGSRDGVRPTRESSREALAAAAGSEVEPARSQQARETLGNIKELVAKSEKVAAKLAKDAWQLPVPPGAYRLTAEFGSCSNLWSHCHTGLDFAAPSGTPVRAVAAGQVTSTSWAGAYGNRTVLTHEDGTETWYCHQLEFGVRPGDPVISGQQIGRVGSTGNSTGPHLHLEVRPGGGDAVDPADALAFHGATP